MTLHDHAQGKGRDSGHADVTDHPTLRTDQAVSSRGREWLRSGYDLLIEGPEGVPARRIPVCYSHMTIGSEHGPKANDIVLKLPDIANRQGILKVIQANLFFNNLNPAFEVKVNGEACSFSQLGDGDVIQIGSHRITVLKLSKVVAFLEGYTDPHRRQQWTLSGKRTCIGRPGKRSNQISLKDKTVSREHATILHTEGHFVLHPDASNTVWVNSEAVKGMHILNDEDLIQVGQQLLRFRSTGAERSAPPRALLPSQATILFSDIWNYTSIAESRPLEEMIGQLNEVYKSLGRVILDHKGLLLTYLGDAMMAVFGADQESEHEASVHANLAVSCGIGMLRALHELNAQWKTRGMPELELGIGIATGEVMMGDVGLTGHREFAAMGDTTNVASRIEKLTKSHRIHLLINGETARMVEGNFSLRELGCVEVKGRRKKVELYQVVGAKA